MNVCGKSMCKILDALGVYNTSKPQLAAEISAYEKGMGMVLSEVDSLIDDLFISTASMDSLNIRERLFRPVNTDITIEEKRKLLTERGVKRGCFVNDVNEKLVAAGITGNITENYLDGVYVNILSLAGVTEELALMEAEAFLPAHLPYYVDFTGTIWGKLDSLDKTFGTIDSEDKAWGE